MKIIIAGIRYWDYANKTVFDSYEIVKSAVIRSAYSISEVVTTDSEGVAYFAKKWSLDYLNKPATIFSPKWGLYGKRDISARIKRNHRMIDYSEASIVIWDGSSDGTKDIVTYSRACKKPIHIEIAKSGR